MTDRLKIDEIKCVEKLIAFLEDNKVQEIDDLGEATDTLDRFEDIVARVQECLTGLKLALGDRYHTAYKGREKHMLDARRYVWDLKARSKEIRRLARQQLADDRTSHCRHAAEMRKTAPTGCV